MGPHYANVSLDRDANRARLLLTGSASVRSSATSRWREQLGERAARRRRPQPGGTARLDAHPAHRDGAGRGLSHLGAAAVAAEPDPGELDLVVRILAHPRASGVDCLATRRDCERDLAAVAPRRARKSGTRFGRRGRHHLGGALSRARIASCTSKPASIAISGGPPISFPPRAALVAVEGDVFASRPCAARGSRWWKRPAWETSAPYLNGLDMGRTDSLGRLIVPEPAAVQRHRLAIADSDIPFERQPAKTSELVTTRYRGAAVCASRRSSWHARHRALEDGGKGRGTGDLSVENRAAAQLADQPRRRVHFDKLPPGSYQVRRRSTISGCRLTLTVPASEEAILDLGELECRPEAP